MDGENIGVTVVGQLVVQFTRRYMVLRRCDPQGNILDEDFFRYPFDLSRQETRQEVAEAYGILFDYANDSINGVIDDDDEGVSD